MERMSASWQELLQEELNLPYMKELGIFLEKEEEAGKKIYPPKNQRFQAFLETPFDQVKVVIVGQDPYHGDGQAHGLCFSVEEKVTKLPPSLKNIFKELQADLGIAYPKIGCLSSWARQGVFLLNSTLTVEEGSPKSHFGKGWERFTDQVIQKLAERKDPIVFLLWGKLAEEKGSKILSSGKQHQLLIAAHPSPFSASGFLGCRHFSKANEFLVKNGHKPICWSIH